MSSTTSWSVSFHVCYLPFLSSYAMLAAISFSDNCERAICSYTGQFSISSLCVPLPTIFPSSSTKIWSACKIVLTRWATMNTVLSVISSRSAFLTATSVLKSRAEKLSSNIYIFAFRATALASQVSASDRRKHLYHL